MSLCKKGLHDLTVTATREGRCGPCRRAWLQHKRATDPRYRQEKGYSTELYRTSERRRLKQREVDIRRKYGISLEQYDEMLAKQGGVCLLCRQPETEKTNLGLDKALAVDHDWDTGEIRGLLCRKCNVLAGRSGPLPVGRG